MQETPFQKYWGISHVSTTAYNTFSRAQEGFPGAVEMGVTTRVQTCEQKACQQQFIPLGQINHERLACFTDITSSSISKVVALCSFLEINTQPANPIATVLRDE